MLRLAATWQTQIIIYSQVAISSSATSTLSVRGAMPLFPPVFRYLSDSTYTPVTTAITQTITIPLKLD